MGHRKSWPSVNPTSTWKRRKVGSPGPMSADVQRLANRPHLSIWTVLCLGGGLLAEIVSRVLS